MNPSPSEVFSFLFYFSLIGGLFFVFPCPLFLHVYRSNRRRKYLASVNERFMREWKAKEQSK